MNPPSHAQVRSLWPWAVVLAGAWLAQFGAWQAAFYMDDFHHILMRGEVLGTAPIELGWKGRFLTYFCWRALYLLFGPSTMAFHAFNWGLHGAVALVSYAVLRDFVRLGPEGIREEAQPLAFWGALVFAVHPLCVEPVHYAAQTTLLLATLLAMLSCGAFLRWRASGQWGWGIAVPLLVLFAGMAKEPGFFHALILLFFTAWLGERKALASGKQRLWVWMLVGFGMLVFVFAWLEIVLGKLGNLTELGHHCLTQSRVFGEYVSRMFVPVALSSDHHLPWTIAWTDTEAVAKLIVLGVAAILILERYLRGNRWFAALLGLVVFHLLLRFAYTLDEPMVEYRAYPAMPWCGLLMVVGLRSLTDLRFPNLRWLVRPALGLLVVCYAMLSWSRSQVWQTEQAVVQDVLHRYPLNLRAMGIYFKDLMVRNQPEPVVMGQGMPDMVEAAILTYNEKGHRVYSERRLHLDYTSCQYFIVRALLLTGDHETALAKARSLLDAITTGKRFGSEESKASAYLSLMLCQEIAGDLDGLAETTRAAKEALRDAASLSEMLARELQLLGHDRANNWTVEAGEELKRDD